MFEVGDVTNTPPGLAAEGFPVPDAVAVSTTLVLETSVVVVV